jgi:hypothetical protein
MNLGTVPLLQRLLQARRILVAGAGGGYDLYAGLPLFLYLQSRAEAVHLGNTSFAALGPRSGRRLTAALTRIDADTTGSDDYFPERTLSRWFRAHGQDVPVYCFQRTGVLTLVRGWRSLVESLRLDAVVLVDGGTDSLMRGDESGLGTPHEDLASIAAVHSLQVPCKVLTCIGFGVDAFDKVCHADFLEAVAALQRQGAFLGAFSLLPEMPEARLFQDAVRHALDTMEHAASVMATSIASALEGRFGNHHATWRTSGSSLFISPLMSMYWSFELDAVARRCLYLKELSRTRSYRDVERVIRTFREDNPPSRGWQPIPY